MFHVNADLSLMNENITEHKNGIMVSVNISVKSQLSIVYVKKIIPESMCFLVL